MEGQLTQSQIKEFKNAFDLFDKDRDGSVSRADLEQSLLQLGVKKSAGEIRDMIDEADPGKTGNINFNDFLTVLSSKLRNTDNEEVMRKAFQALDPEKKGYIPASELRKELTTWGKPLSNDEMSKLLKEINCPETGLFEYERFLNAMFMKSG